MKRHLPNLLTLLNLSCGTVAIVLTLEGQWRWGVYLILAASVLDLLDGLSARMLNAGSETGKQLDSLADMVSFGVLPAVFIYTLFKGLMDPVYGTPSPSPLVEWVFWISVLLVPVFTAIRLARFNVSGHGTPYFMGLPSPAHALFWTGIFWQLMQERLLFGNPLHPYFLEAILLIMAFHLILPVPMMTLRFRHFRFRGNQFRYLLLFLSLVIIILTGLAGLSLVILTYILLSLLNLLLRSRVSF